MATSGIWIGILDSTASIPELSIFTVNKMHSYKLLRVFPIDIPVANYLNNSSTLKLFVLSTFELETIKRVSYYTNNCISLVLRIQKWQACRTVNHWDF